MRHGREVRVQLQAFRFDVATGRVPAASAKDSASLRPMTGSRSASRIRRVVTMMRLPLGLTKHHRVGAKSDVLQCFRMATDIERLSRLMWESLDLIGHS
jgi:hypothetical protein